MPEKASAKLVQFLVVVVSLIPIHCAAQQNGTATSSLSVQSSVQVAPPAPQFLVAIYPLPSAPPTNQDAQNQKASTCDFIGDAAAPSRKVTPQSIIALLGNPVPFSLQPGGKDKVLIYSNTPGNTRDPRLIQLEHTIDELIRQGLGDKQKSAKSYNVEVTFPHAYAFADPASSIGALGYTDFTVQDVGKNAVRVTAAGQPDCETLKTFYSRVRDLAWSIRPQSPIHRVFFLNAGDVTGALGGAAGSGTASSSGSSSASTAPANSSSQPSGSGSGASATLNVGAPTSAPTTGSGTTSSGSGASATPAASSAAGKGGSSGSATTGSTSGGGASGSGSSGGSASPGGGPSGGSGNSGSNASSAAAVGNDFLVFNEPVPGDDVAVEERKRIVAGLDLPRPEMILNVWSAQKSSKDGESVRKSQEQLRDAVNIFNQALETAVGNGWSYLRNQTADPNFLDHAFANYIAQRDVAEDLSKGTQSTADYGKTASQFLLFEPSVKVDDAQRQHFNVCPHNQYCLGYESLFHPLKPRLTDLLLATIAAANAVGAADGTINQMEGGVTPEASQTCDDKDTKTLRAHLSDPDHLPFMMECYRKAAHAVFAPANIGLMRAAVADFLFQYKLSQQYPHEFSAYELSQSAQALNSVLTPLVDGFTRDLANFQHVLVELLIEGTDPSGPGWFSERPEFSNNGFITVLTVGGSEATVSTTTQNFLDATQQPALADLVKSITSTTSPAAATGGRTNVLQNITPIQAQVIMGAISAMQSSKIQIGRGLNIDVTPRSLSGASSAEIQVNIKADESATPTYFGGPLDSKNADLSRVAQHDTTTKVRVESIKMFEVSTLTAELDKTRTRFPLLPPFVEIPYIGSVIGIPLPPAKEYHTSTAVISAVVVPTAADIAYGLNFVADRLITSPPTKPQCIWSISNSDEDRSQLCQVRRALSISDLHGAPVKGFHNKLMQCFAERGWRNAHGQWLNGCGGLTFDDLLSER